MQHRGATCQLRPRIPSQRRVSRAAGAPALAVSGKEVQNSSCQSARAVLHWPWSANSLCKDTALARILSPWAHDRGATCQLRPPTLSQRHIPRGAGAPSLAVSGEEAQHASFLLARSVPSWSWSVRALQKIIAPARGLSFHARPWRNVPGPQCQASAACHAAQARRCSLSLGRRRSTRARRARAVLRWLWSVNALGKGAALARSLSPCAHDRGATYQLRPPKQSQRHMPRGAGAPLLAVSMEEAQHASFLRARAVPRWSWSVRALRKNIAPVRGLSFCARLWRDLSAMASNAKPA